MYSGYNYYNRETSSQGKEINDPNALALGTANKEGIPSVRMVLLKGFNKNGFVNNC